MSELVQKRNKVSARLIMSCAVMSMGSIFWGYDIGIISTIYVSPGFVKIIHPSPSETGLITAIFSAGQFFGFTFLAGPVNNRFGRRYGGAIGTLILCIGAALQAGAVNLAMMIVGRIIAGFGTGVVSCSVPLYLSETAPAARRGFFVGANQVGIVFGISLAFWIGYAYSFWDNAVAWRASTAMQFIPAAVFLAGLPFIPESPRWLMERDRPDDAGNALRLLRGASLVQVQAELDEIAANIQWHKDNSVTSARVFFKDKALFSRLWRAWALTFLQQMSGAGGIRYYLPTNFIAAGTSKELSLLASGIDGTVQVGCTIGAMFIFDRIGRRHSLGIGAIIMAWCLLVSVIVTKLTKINGALQLAYPHQVNHTANIVNIFFIFFFTVGYSMGFGPVAWIYSAEIFPANVRSAGLGIASAGASLGAIVVGQVWPVAVANIGARTYFIFMAFNIFSAILVYTCYPETKQKTLEELDSHFGKMNVHSTSEAIPKSMEVLEDSKYETEKA